MWLTSHLLNLASSPGFQLVGSLALPQFPKGRVSASLGRCLPWAVLGACLALAWALGWVWGGSGSQQGPGGGAVREELPAPLPTPRSWLASSAGDPGHLPPSDGPSSLTLQAGARRGPC